MEKYFNKLFEIYLDTTNPKTEYFRILKADVIISILIHVVIYITCLFLLSKVTNIKVKINEKLIIGLIILMIFGFFARLLRSKSIYSLLLRDNKENIALQKTRNIMNNTYLVWYFLS